MKVGFMNISVSVGYTFSLILWFLGHAVLGNPSYLLNQIY